MPGEPPKIKIAPALQGVNKTALVPTGTSGSAAAVIKEPQRKERILRIEINSNDRDFAKYPNPAAFEWITTYPIKNVTSMVIVGGTIPLPIYTIDYPANSFTFNTGTEIKTLTLPPGLYTPIYIAEKFSEVLNQTDGVNKYRVKVDPITQILSVTSTNKVVPFSFLFGTGEFINQFSPGLQKINNPSYMLGFKNQDYTSVGSVLTATFPVNTIPLQRIYLYMNYDSTIDLRSVVLAGGRANPSAIFYCTDQDSVSYYTKALNKDTYENVISPGLIVPRIRSINISLKDEFGNVINTNNRPLSLLLEITVLD